VLPSSLGQLSSLLSLRVGGNSLQGSVPSSLCAITTFTQLSTVNNTNLLCYAPCLSSLASRVAQFGNEYPCGFGKCCADVVVSVSVIMLDLTIVSNGSVVISTISNTISAAINATNSSAIFAAINNTEDST
jgi:hypothetical protein